jgi:hypothetical protein
MSRAHFGVAHGLTCGRVVSPTTIFAPASTPGGEIFGLGTFVIGRGGTRLRLRLRAAHLRRHQIQKRPGDDGSEPAQFYGSNHVEVAWTVIPIVIIVVLFLATARVIASVRKADRPAEPHFGNRSETMSTELLALPRIITTNLLSSRDEAARARHGRSCHPPPRALIR